MPDTGAPDRPNIIWIMADDLSWGDLGCFGADKILTPNIDRLADEGLRFTACYSGSTVCAPSRSSLMQGLHQGHATVRNNSAPGGYRHHLQPEDVTVAQVLRAAGYRCGLFGKWGLAVEDQTGRPNEAGFDEFCGYLNQRHAHSYYPPHLFRNTERIEFPQHAGHDHTAPNEYDQQGRIIPNGMADPGAARYSFAVYAEAAAEGIREGADRPFFAYLAYTIPHQAFEVPELGPYTDLDWPLLHRIYAAMVTRMDDAIGRLLAMLDDYGIAEDTLIFFTSDNGYSHAAVGEGPTLDGFFDHAGPYRGRKGNLHQGGVRVPTVARWPAAVEPGRTCNHPWAYWDLMATAAELAGVRCPPTDGVSIAPILRGEAHRLADRPPLSWEHGNEQAVRLDQWWAHRPHPDQPVEVYHADADPQQEHDRAADLPELVSRVEEIMAAEHEENLYFPAPGQTREEWEAELEARGIVLPVNIDV